ncbi:MAG: ArsR/SmtB family transcription factor [Candidatus Aquicultor sp.]
MKAPRNKIELLKVVAHPLRVEILEQLEEGVKCVSDFEESIETSQPNISQHLALLRRYGLIDYYVDGRLRRAVPLPKKEPTREQGGVNEVWHYYQFK